MRFVGYRTRWRPGRFWRSQARCCNLPDKARHRTGRVGDRSPLMMQMGMVQMGMVQMGAGPLRTQKRRHPGPANEGRSRAGLKPELCRLHRKPLITQVWLYPKPSGALWLSLAPEASRDLQALNLAIDASLDDRGFQAGFCAQRACRAWLTRPNSYVHARRRAAGDCGRGEVDPMIHMAGARCGPQTLRATQRGLRRPIKPRSSAQACVGVGDVNRLALGVSYHLQRAAAIVNRWNALQSVDAPDAGRARPAAAQGLTILTEPERVQSMATRSSDETAPQRHGAT